jgi:hypothetical protein
MKTSDKVVVSAVVIAGLLGAANMWAQAGAGAGRNYDPKTVETVQGQVISIETMTPPQGKGGMGRGAGMGIHLNLQTGKETIPVHLGPDWVHEKADAAN